MKHRCNIADSIITKIITCITYFKRSGGGGGMRKHTHHMHNNEQLLQLLYIIRWCARACVILRLQTTHVLKIQLLHAFLSIHVNFDSQKNNVRSFCVVVCCCVLLGVGVWGVGYFKNAK